MAIKQNTGTLAERLTKLLQEQNSNNELTQIPFKSSKDTVVPKAETTSEPQTL